MTITVAPGASTYCVVNPEEGNLDYQMDVDYYYNKTDKKEAFFRVRLRKPYIEDFYTDDTAAWNDCKLDVKPEILCRAYIGSKSLSTSRSKY